MIMSRMAMRWAKNPTDVGDYIIEAVFAGDDNINAATSELGLTISKAQHANNGVQHRGTADRISGIGRVHI